MDHFCELNLEVPEALAGDFLAKLHYVSQGLAHFAYANGGRRQITFRVKPGYEAEVAKISTRIADAARKMCGSFRAYESRVLRTNRGAGEFKSDPQPMLMERGDLWTAGKGRMGLGEMPSRLIEVFESDIKAYAKDFNAKPNQYPSLIGADTLDRCKYLGHFPHSLTLVTHLREDSEGIHQFSREAKWKEDHLDCDPAALSQIECLLAPSICFHYYASLADTVQTTELTVAARGKCFRYESGNMAGLERLWDFTMSEVIFVGPGKYTLERRARAIEKSAALLDGWGLSYEIRTATDPFFIEDFAVQTAFQAAFDLKYEIRAELPYKNATLAVGSFNYHQDFFGRMFNIKGQDGAPYHSSCVGFGLERLALAFLAQYGVDEKKWPRAVAEKYREGARA